ncbi:MAG: aminotransferase DegT [Halobacteriovoraceae bacterium]|nr:aminotransferase DegT [Halobacteriovoraceae bacterium]|tara:strand:+ start:59942 stop:61372 length:1431 start_codon:yes stop_codon:yes gene_type:complete
MIEKLLCSKDSLLLDVLKVINENEKGIAFIVDENRKLLGVITDGDIRRSLLSGGDLQEDALKHSNRDFTYATNKESLEAVLKKAVKGRNIIPILNSKKEVTDYFEYSAEVRVPVAAPSLRGNEFKYLTEAFLSSWISSSGRYINQFERNFSNFTKTKHGIAVSNGTCALHLALLALNIGPGDEVIVPDLTFAATINSVIHAGATPVIVDIDETTWCISPPKIEESISPRTKAIICVHLFGQPCDMESILEITKENNISLIEDCAQAHGAQFKGRPVGSFGDVGCFSFFGNKIITTGEGGMCVTNNSDVDKKIRLLRDHGMNKDKRYWHDVVGFNYRLTNLQAAIGVAQLENISKTLYCREKIEQKYKSVLDKFNFLKLQAPPSRNCDKVTWLVCALAQDNKTRNLVVQTLSRNGIDTRPFFYALSEMPLYKKYVCSNEVSVQVSQRGISFPTVLNLEPSYFEKFKLIMEEEIAKSL